MDFLMELIITGLFEGANEGIIKSPKVKTWVKTVVMLLLSELLPVAFIILGVSVCQNGNAFGGTVIITICSALAIAFLIACILGHKRNWKY